MSQIRSEKRPFLFRLYWLIRSRPILFRRWLRAQQAAFLGRGGAELTRERWSPSEFTRDLRDSYWTSARPVREHLHRMVSGDPNCDWVTWMFNRYAVGSALDVLVIGTGEGWLERALAHRPSVRSVVGIDLAPEALERAAEAARAEGIAEKIRHQVVDLNTSLPDGPFDLVFAHDAIHHVRDLEGFFDRLSAALKPGGVLLFCEYVGPKRFQYDDRRMEIINSFFVELPERLRFLPLTGAVAPLRFRCDPVQLAKDDPSEAVRSDEILPVLRERMKVLEVIPYGGGLLQPLLYEIVANFRDDSPDDEAILRQLCAAERVLTQQGVIEPDYVVAAASALL